MDNCTIRTLILSSFCLFCMFGCNIKKDGEFDVKDQTGEVRLREIWKDGILKNKKYYSEGKLYQEEYYNISSDPEKIYVKTYENNNVVNQGYFHNGKMHGVFEFFDESGNLEAYQRLNDGNVVAETHVDSLGQVIYSTTMSQIRSIKVKNDGGLEVRVRVEGNIFPIKELFIDNKKGSYESGVYVARLNSYGMGDNTINVRILEVGTVGLDSKNHSFDHRMKLLYRVTKMYEGRPYLLFGNQLSKENK